ncbi:uncharacterized protein PF3D7_1120000-like [Palaemon carinicauda]|uniref:uncharacterized protein PF3D7_1120000-like n=1 Tax=Palaemon carinicauda TaxID=392227 RepID=UPI0035B5A803
MWIDIIRNLTGRFNWPQQVGSAFLEQNLACEDMTVQLQGQLRTLQESWIFKWFSWLLPEAPRFEDCRAVASQDGFLGRWLQRCPWIGGWWKAREELQRCELGLHQMKREALRFKDELKSTWFVGKLHSELDLGEMKEVISNGNQNFYIGIVAAASVIFGGIMLARRRMAGNDVDDSSLEEYVPEMENGCDLLELKMEDEDRTTFLQNLEDENNKLHGQLNELRSIVHELNRAKETQEKMTFEKASEYQKLEAECVEKDLRMKELETLLEILKVKNKEIKKNENEKTEQINKLKRNVDELKDEKKKLESECVGKDLKMKEHENLNEKMKLECECVGKDLQMKEHENLVKILKEENEQSKKALSEETEQVNNLKLEVEKLKNEKDEQKADLLRDYEKLEFVCKIKDLEILQAKKIVEEFKTENEELKRVQSKKTEQLNKLKSEVNELKIEKEKQKFLTLRIRMNMRGEDY